MDSIKSVHDLVEILKDIDPKCDIVVRVPGLTDHDVRITKITKEYDLTRDSLCKDKVILICVQI